MKLPGYTIFEKIRKNNEGGGLMSIIHDNLKPIQIPSEHPEFLEVDIFGNFGSIRIINSYGPQEYWSWDTKVNYFTELESRIILAKSDQKFVCLELDANSKLGNKIIPGDPHPMSQNGKLLSDIISRQNLIVVNATDKCIGEITRYKKTVRGEEKSILDYFIVCQEFYQKVENMLVDEERKYVFARFYKTKNKTTCVESDHNTLILQFRFGWNQKIKTERKEIYNVRNYEGQEKFKDLTSNNQNLIKCLTNRNVYTGGRKWLKEIQHMLCLSFKKIRISKSKPPLKKETSDLFNRRELLKERIAKMDNLDENDKNKLVTELADVDRAIADIDAKENFDYIKKTMEHLLDNTENLNPVRMWDLKKKLCANKSVAPTAKKNKNGKLVTEHCQLKALYENTYKNRLKHKEIQPELQNLYDMKMYLFDLRLKVTKCIKSETWSTENLLNVLKKLKKNKSADPHGLVYELFRPEIIGKNLLSSLLMLCNQVKAQLIIPEFLTSTTITSIWKQKGEKSDLENDRGIFGVSKIRAIIEKLVYEDTNEVIDNNMSDSNVGARKKRNIRDNLFVLYACINDAIRNKKNIDIQYYDISKCFDTLWAQDTMNDYYDVGVKDDKFALISLLNKKCNVKVKTPVGDTENFEVQDIEMQGTVTAPLKCSVLVDTIGRYCYTYSTGLYFYRNASAIPPLGMIDDVAGIANCNDDSIVLNTIVNTRIEAKKLEFNLKKCVNMHIGPDSEKCQTLRAHGTRMENVVNQLYLGDIISNSGSNEENIKNRVKKGYSAISQIKSLINSVGFGRFEIQTGLLMRDTIFGSKILLNCEIWHSLLKSQIEQLEVIDRILIRQILGAHSKTGIEWLYIETGKFDIKSLVQIRRLMYWWHILSRKKSELIRRVYETQKISNNAGDWIKLIENDKRELDIQMDKEDIQGVSQESIKNYIKSKVKTKFLQHLNNIKKNHSKSEYLNCQELRTAEYLNSPKFNTQQKQLLFRLRSRTLDVKMNFPGQHKDLLCISCGVYPESQGHLLQCPKLIANLGYLADKTSKLNEYDIYGDIEKQQIIVNIYSDILEVRGKMKNGIEK